MEETQETFLDSGENAEELSSSRRFLLTSNEEKFRLQPKWNTDFVNIINPVREPNASMSPDIS